jgi:hypothetical protein
MALPPNIEVTTEAPVALRADLRTEHRDIRDELLRIESEAPKRWIATAVSEAGTVRAQRDGLYSGAGSFTIFTPGRPKPGDCFRVLSAGLTNVTVMSDDGIPIQGSTAPDVWLASGFREYTYVQSPLDARVQGWWRQA